MEKRKSLPITFEERKLVEKYAKQGISGNQIARLLKRSLNLINCEFKRAGGRENYSAKESQRLSEKTKEEKYKRLSKMNKGRIVNPNVKRIENLEMQIEILHETIKGMMDK